MARHRPPRLRAALLAALLLCATPLPAAADVENVWGRWTSQVLDRNSKWEIPLALIASVPAMIVITPFWAGQLLLEALED